jgi:hypothetical protein
MLESGSLAHLHRMHVEVAKKVRIRRAEGVARDLATTRLHAQHKPEPVCACWQRER